MPAENLAILIPFGVWALALAAILTVEIIETIRGYAQEIGDQLEWHA